MLSGGKFTIMASGPSYPPPPPPPGAGVPVKKKTSPILWIVIGIAGFFMLLIIAVMGIGFYAVHKAKQAGFDTELMKKNPTLAAAKMAATLNRDVQVLSSDDDKGTLTVRDKRTGKISTMTFDSRRGKFVISEDGKDVTLSTNSDPNGGIDIKSSDGSTLKIGGGAAKIPSWLPDYPGSQPETAMTTKDANTEAGMYHFKTKDAADQVVKFYEDKLKSSGMKITSNISGQSAVSSGGLITAEDEAKHNVMVTIGTESGETNVAVTYSTKK